MIKEMKWKEAKLLIKSSEVTYLWFGAEWCGDCIMMEPVVEELAEKFKENKKINFVKVDAEESSLFRDPDSEYKVMKIPTHVFMKNGVIMNIEYEYFPLELMIEEINKLI